MKYDKVTIRQIPDEVASLTGLDKHNRSKMPGTMDFLQAGVSPDGRYITGFDEYGYDLALLKDKELAKEVSAERKELRESLEKALSKDLSGTSKFWETFGVQVFSDQELTLNKVNPLDVVRYHVLIANGYAAPSKDKASFPEFLQAKYYCFVEERAESEDVSTQKKRDQARSELYKLSDNYDLSLLIGQHLIGDKFKKGMKPDTIYTMLSDFINSKESDNINKFLKATKATVEDLQYKVTIDRAIKRKIIGFREGYYQRGQVTLGKTINDVYASLKKPEFATEFLSIKDEVE